MEFELYKKVLRGQGTQEETEQVMRWLQEDPAAFEASLLQEAGAIEQERMPDAIRQQMMDHFAQKGIPASVAPVVNIARKRYWYQWTAAAILLAVLAGWWLYPSQSKAPVLTWLEIKNTGTTVKPVTLPDSSKVWLNALAILRYRDDFNAHAQREVQLSGEGYFRVMPDKEHPFVVQTDHLITNVLGTEFNVEAYPDEQVIKVTLQQGKVQVSDSAGAQKEVLLPGQMALYSRSGGRLQVKSSTITDADTWTSGGLVLNDVPLQDALQRIARKYGQSVESDPVQTMKHQHITAYYEKMDLEQVLAQLGFTCRFSTKKTANGYRIVWK
jgi:ferric-dicitrate binding protein FerR (iron transport regulator)